MKRKDNVDYYQDNETEIVEDGELGSLEERGESVREATSLVADIRPHLPHLGSTKPALDAKERYSAGKKFRVMKPGARLEGIVTFGKFKAGHCEMLEVGDIIECTGWWEGMSETGFMEVNFRTENSPANTLWLQFWPWKGIFLPWPLDGWLEEYDPEAKNQEEIEAPQIANCCPAGMSCEDCENLDNTTQGFGNG